MLEKLLLDPAPEQRNGLVIDVDDARRPHDVAEEARIVREVLPEIGDAGCPRPPQQIANAGEIDLPERDRHGLEQVLIAPLAGAQGLFRLFARGDVDDADHGGAAAHLSRRIGDREQAVEQAAVDAAEAAFGRIVRVPLGGVGVGLGVDLRALLGPEDLDVAEQLLLVATPEQRHGLVVDVDDARRSHHFPHKVRVGREVAGADP